MRGDGPPATLSLTELYAPVASELTSVKRLLAEELRSDLAFIGELSQHVSRFHGKLLRPGLLLLSGQACGRLRPEHAVLGAVTELVHLATLVHDDVLDESQMRRRAATVNCRWGNGRAVLAGDYLYSHAFHLCSTLDSQLAARLIGRTAITVCEGELLQVVNRGNFDLTEEQYLDIVRRKTAALLETCCELGARFAGADEATVGRLRTFGRGLGIAFQIIDDLLDLVGEESEVGKTLGRDLSEGEPTLPVIHYLRTCPAERRPLLLQLVGDRAPGARRQVAALLESSGSLAYSQTMAQRHVEEARRALRHLPDSAARASLDALAEFVIARRH